MVSWRERKKYQVIFLSLLNMDGKEIFKEILKSPKLKELVGVPESEEIKEDYDSQSQRREITVIRSIIEGQLRHTSDDGIFRNIKTLFDL